MPESNIVNFRNILKNAGTDIDQKDEYKFIMKLYNKQVLVRNINNYLLII